MWTIMIIHYYYPSTPNFLDIGYSVTGMICIPENMCPREALINPWLDFGVQ